ncbi:MAG: hypothetical protein LUD51_07110 [Clostridia bacterium]|nr:hypothetical protein [Clostridia bacterium]
MADKKTANDKGCSAEFASRAEAFRDKIRDEGEATLNNPAVNKDLSALADENLFRRTWIPVVYKVNVSERKEDFIRERKTELEAFDQDLDKRNKNLALIYKWLLAGSVLIICLLASDILLAVFTCTVGAPPNGLGLVRLYGVYPVVIVLAIAASLVSGKALHLWNKNGKKLLAVADQEQTDQFNRFKMDLKEIEASVREELDSDLVRNGFATTTDDDLRVWWSEKDKSVKLKKKFKYSRKMNTVYIVFRILLGLSVMGALACVIGASLTLVWY